MQVSRMPCAAFEWRVALLGVGEALKGNRVQKTQNRSKIEVPIK